MENAKKIQAVLYSYGGQMKKAEMASLLNISTAEVAEAATQLTQLLEGQGVELITTDTTLSLRTADSQSHLIETLQRQDEEKDVGTAGLEVLAIVLYKGSISRAAIDYIRGVNSSGTLRQLVLRGLLERNKDTTDARAWVYSATPELLAYVGVSSVDQLPEYEELTSALHEQQFSDSAETEHASYE